MFHLKDNWPSGMRIFQIPLSWFRKVSGFLNNFIQGEGIEIEKPDNPGLDTPVRIKLSEDALEKLDQIDKIKKVSAPEKITPINSGTASGTSMDDGERIFGSSSDDGIEIFVATRAADSGDGETGKIRFRKFIIAGDGRIYAIDKESAAYGVYNA